MKIKFLVVDDIKLSTETVEIDIKDCPFDIPKNKAKLKGFCRSIALLKEHYKECAIENITIDDSQDKAARNKYDAYSVHKFAEFLQDYARACQSSGYSGIGVMDIEDKMQEFLL